MIAASLSTLVAIVSLILLSWLSKYSAECSSTGGQIAQAFDAHAARDCANASAGHGVAFAVFIASAFASVALWVARAFAKGA